MKTDKLKVLAFAASTSRESINKRLVTYAAGLLTDVNTEVVDLNDYSLPLFCVDIEREIGQPENATRFFEKIGTADALLISFAEHNGSYSAAYKNLFDWCSRIDPKVYQGKPVVMLATSPGGRGGAGVLEQATKSAPFFGAELRGQFSLPSFNDHFKNDEVITQSVKQSIIDTVNQLFDTAT